MVIFLSMAVPSGIQCTRPGLGCWKKLSLVKSLVVGTDASDDAWSNSGLTRKLRGSLPYRDVMSRGGVRGVVLVGGDDLGKRGGCGVERGDAGCRAQVSGKADVFLEAERAIRTNSCLCVYICVEAQWVLWYCRRKVGGQTTN